MKYLQIVTICLFVFLGACHSPGQLNKNVLENGQLRVGFDVDDTILFSRDNFLKAPHMSDDPDHVDYGWINLHDSLHSTLIQPVADLIGFLRAQGHEIYFITARPGVNGEAVARYLSRSLGFPVVKEVNLFFSPKEKDPITGRNMTTKHKVISTLGLHIFYGDADNDMVAASVAGIRGVRVVRDVRSVEAYSKNYFGDTRSEPKAAAPYSETQYQQFIAKGVGPYGETIFPIYSFPQDTLVSENP